MRSISLVKDDVEHLVPEPWRAKFHQIADAFVANDFQLRDHIIDGVSQVDLATAAFFQDSIRAYGDDLAPLDNATWERPIYRWMEGHWLFLVDLTTTNEPVSDLALHAILDEESGQLRVESVHVP